MAISTAVVLWSFAIFCLCPSKSSQISDQQINLLDDKLKIESVLVTGANRGIGLEFVRQLSQLEDAPKFIFATYRNYRTLQDLKAIQVASSKSRVILIKLDVRVLEDIEAAKKKIEETVGDRGLTFLINNAGVLRILTFPDLTPDNLELHFGTNTVGPVMVLQTLFPLLEQAARVSNSSGKSVSKAAVLNMSSKTASITRTGVEFTSDLIVAGYKISKAGLNMAMRVIAANTKDNDVLIVNMCPGWVRTDMGGKDIADIEPEESIADMIEILPKLNETHHGSYIDRFGKAFPY